MLLWIIGILLFLCAAVCIYCFYTCFYSANSKPQDPYGMLHGEQFIALKEKIYKCTKHMESVPFEPVTTKSFDGLTLAGRYYHVADGAPVKIIFHGYRSIALRDCAGGFGMARKLGMNVLAIDQRAHGESQGHVITFGIRERRDCLSWIEYISKRFGADTPIILSGLSMGAATVIMATSLPLPENVVCVLADCPYSSPAGIIQKVCKDQRYPAKTVYPFIRAASFLFGGFDLEETGAVASAKLSKKPILLLHGEDDRFVPCDMSRMIHESSNGCTQFVTFPYAGHGLSYMVAPAEYEKAVFSFLGQFPELKPYVQNNLFDKV